MTDEEQPERIPLHQPDPALRKRRAWSGFAGVLLVAAAFGGIGGLIGGRVAGLVTAAVVALPLVYVVLFGLRRQVWLTGTTIVVRAWRERHVDLVTAKRIDLLVSDVRGARTVSMLVTGARGKSAKVDLAIYAGTGGRELGILALRKLADGVLNNVEANGMIFSELLVAQLRAEARGEAVPDRPLHRLASAAPSGKLAQRFTMEAVSRFVATLD